MRVELRSLGAMIAAAVLAVAVSACGGGSTVNTSSGGGPSGSGSSGGGAATTAGATGSGAWTLGSLVDLTGTDANGGAAQQQGIKYLINQINASGGVGGHKLAIKFCDTQSTPSGAAQCAQQLAGVNTHVVLAQSIDPPTRGALPYLTKDVVVAVDPILLPKTGTHVFQASGASSVVAGAMVAGAKASGFKTIGVLYTTDTSGTHQLEAAKEAAAKAGMKVVAQPQDAGSNDVTPQLVKLRAAGADVIYLASVGTNTAAAVNSYRTLGMSQPVIAGAAAVTNGFLHSLSSIPQHLYGVSQLLASPLGLPSSTAKAFTQYRSQFKATEGEPADTQTTTAVYDGCVATSALKAAGTFVSGMVKFLKSQPINCLGSTMRFNIPGLNVVSGQPAALAAASTTASNGWGPVQGKL
jgi:branched-chain amino acid transport system substrate-binding protein